jgi:hypothetical protein
MKLTPSKFSMDLMPIKFGGSAESSAQIIGAAAPPPGDKKSAPDDDDYSRIRLYCN